MPKVINVNYGIDFADVNADGRVDMWVADCGRVGDQLLVNAGAGRFTDATPTNLSRPAAMDHWRWTAFGEGAIFADGDGDGDLYAGTGVPAEGETGMVGGSQEHHLSLATFADA